MGGSEPFQKPCRAFSFKARRQEGQGERLGSFPADGFGSQQTASNLTSRLTAARGRAADAGFGAARKSAAPVDVRGALAAIDDHLGPMKAGGGVTGGPIDAKPAQVRARLAGDGTELSDFTRVLDVKKDMQDAIGEAVRAGRNNEARLLKQVAGEPDGALERSSPDYRAANDSFARASRVIDAVDEGVEMARPSTRASDNLARFGKMTPDGQTAARVGYGDRQMARVEQQAGPLTNRARPLTSAKSAAERQGDGLRPRPARPQDRPRERHVRDGALAREHRACGVGAQAGGGVITWKPLGNGFRFRPATH